MRLTCHHAFNPEGGAKEPTSIQGALGITQDAVVKGQKHFMVAVSGVSPLRIPSRDSRRYQTGTPVGDPARIGRCIGHALDSPRWDAVAESWVVDVHIAHHYQNTEQTTFEIKDWRTEFFKFKTQMFTTQSRMPHPDFVVPERLVRKAREELVESIKNQNIALQDGMVDALMADTNNFYDVYEAVGLQFWWKHILNTDKHRLILGSFEYVAIGLALTQGADEKNLIYFCGQMNKFFAARFPYDPTKKSDHFVYPSSSVPYYHCLQEGAIDEVNTADNFPEFICLLPLRSVYNFLRFSVKKINGEALNERFALKMFGTGKTRPSFKDSIKPFPTTAPAPAASASPPPASAPTAPTPSAPPAPAPPAPAILTTTYEPKGQSMDSLR